MSRKRKFIYGAVVLAVVVGSVVIYFLVRHNTASIGSNAVQSTSTTQPAESMSLTSGNILTLEKMSSPNRAEQELSLIPEMHGGTWSETAGLPAGATLKVILKSFRPDGIYRLVDANVTGSVQAKLTLKLAFREGEWLIYETKEVK